MMLAASGAWADAVGVGGRRVDVVAFGLWGDQSVFAEEAKGAARILHAKFGTGRVVVRANTRSRSDATPEALRADLSSLGNQEDPDRDVLFVVLSSHGGPEGVGVVAPGRQETLSPSDLREMIRESGARARVIIVSACYSGVFAEALANPDTLVITAADSEHSSFGCRDGARWTYFGKAFFADALPHAANLSEAFQRAKQLVGEREAREGFHPSNPQMSGGARVLERLGEIR